MRDGDKAANEGLREYVSRRWEFLIAVFSISLLAFETFTMKQQFESMRTTNEIMREQLEVEREDQRHWKKVSLLRTIYGDQEAGLRVKADAIRSYVELNRGRVFRHGKLEVPGMPDLSQSVVEELKLTGSELAFTDFRDASFHDSSVASSDLSGSMMMGTGWENVNATAACLSKAGLSGAKIRDSVFALADLRDSNLYMAEIENSDFIGADLTRASLDSVTIKNSTFLEAIFNDTNLRNVTWVATQCPDGTYSQNNGNTCRGHLNPRSGETEPYDACSYWTDRRTYSPLEQGKVE